MPADQMHGKTFENVIKAANGIFSHAAADRGRSPRDRFDIDAVDDKELGIPTSIKATGGNSIALSSALGFWESFDHTPYRLLVGQYRQEGAMKKFTCIHEFILRADHRNTLLGGVELAEVKDFHCGLKEFGPGRHDEARVWHRARKAALKERLGLVGLNPKVDAKTQRRLQCSVKLAPLIRAVGDDNYKIHSSGFGILALPLRIISSRRNA